jgi:hypothetical protein
MLSSLSAREKQCIQKVSLEEQILQGERRGMNFEGFRTRLLVIEAKDTRMDIDALNTFRVSVGTKPSPQKSDRKQKGNNPAENLQSNNKNFSL